MQHIDFDQHVNKVKKVVGQLNTYTGNRPAKSCRDRRPRSVSENRALLRAVVQKVAKAKKEGLLVRQDGGYALKWNE